MAAEKNIGFSVTIRGVSKEAQELARLEVQMKSLRKAKLDLIKQSQKEGQVSAENTRKIAALTNQINANAASQKQLKRAITPVQSSFVKLGKTILTSLGIFASAAVVVRGFFKLFKEGNEAVREFEDKFTNVLTLLDEAQKIQYEGILKRGALDLMSEYGFTIEETNQALFDYISATGDAAGANEFLQKSAKVAIAGASTLSAVVDGATNIMGSMGEKAGSTEEILNAFFAAQVKGKTTVQELAENVGKVASSFAAANIPLNEGMVTFAGLTLAMGGTEESATALANVIKSIIAPSRQAKAIFNDLGIETGITAVKQSGLLNKLLEVAAAYEGNNDVLTEIIPNIRAFRGIAALSSEQVKILEDNLKDLNDTELVSQLVQEAYNEKMATGARQTKIAAEAWKVYMIEIGGGESVFKKFGRTFRELWIDSVQGSTEALREHRLERQVFLDIFRREGKKRVPGLVADMYGTPEEVKEDAEEITTILTDEEKARQEKLARIRKLAAERDKENQEKAIKEREKAEEEAFKKRLDAIREEGEELEEEERFYTDMDARIMKSIIDNAKAREDAREEEKEARSQEMEQLQADIIKRTDLEIEELKRRNEAIKILEQANYDNKVRIMQAATDVLAGLAGKNKALRKASLIADKAVAIAEIIMQTKRANAAMTLYGAAMAIPTGGFSIAAAQAINIKNNIIAGLSIAAIIAATATALAGFVKGGKINRGIPVNTGTKDDTLIVANKTETVLTKDHVARLGGPGVMKRIGVPGYAQGGYIGQTPPEAQFSGFDINQLADLMNSIEVTLNLNKVDSGLKELEVINKSQPL